jgi:hypothetical protein
VAVESSLALRIAHGLDRIDRHIQSEYTNDVPTIMATISERPRYALISGQTGQPKLTVLNDTSVAPRAHRHPPSEAGGY